MFSQLRHRICKKSVRIFPPYKKAAQKNPVPPCCVGFYKICCPFRRFVRKTAPYALPQNADYLPNLRKHNLPALHVLAELLQLKYLPFRRAVRKIAPYALSAAMDITIAALFAQIPALPQNAEYLPNLCKHDLTDVCVLAELLH